MTVVCRRDVIGDDTVSRIKEGLLGGDAPVEVKRFEDSGHLPHLDEREEYVTVRGNTKGMEYTGEVPHTKTEGGLWMAVYACGLACDGSPSACCCVPGDFTYFAV